MNADNQGFSFVTHWQRNDINAGNSVRDFWLAEGALGTGIDPANRVREVVAHARAADGSVAAVCTAVPKTLPSIGQPMYYYRCFIGKNWRKTQLVSAILLYAFDVLEEYARANDFPCIGLLLELENTRFSKALRMPVWSNSVLLNASPDSTTGFVYAGISARGLELRVRYFRGARLKKTPVRAR
jgi:hypothetical protein